MAYIQKRNSTTTLENNLMAKVKIYTTAPDRYDWGFTLMMIDNVGVTNRGKIVRLVEIEAGRVEEQVGRYQSGLFPGWSEEQFQKEVKSNFVIKSKPSEEIHYKRLVFDVEKFIDNANAAQLEDMRLLIDQIEDTKGVLYTTGGYKYFFTITGTKDYCAGIQEQITQKWTKIVGA